MLTTPHFQNHAQQQAMLGCAATLDPIKHPRRFAQQKARERIAKEMQWAERAESTEGVAYARARLVQIRADARAKRVTQLRELAGKGLTIMAISREMKLARITVMNMLVEFEIERGPKMQLEA